MCLRSFLQVSEVTCYKPTEHLRAAQIQVHPSGARLKLFLQFQSAARPGKLGTKAGVGREMLLLFCCSLSNWRPSETLCLSSQKSFLQGSNERTQQRFAPHAFSCKLQSPQIPVHMRAAFQTLRHQRGFRTRLSRCNSTDNSHLHPNLNLLPV